MVGAALSPALDPVRQFGRRRGAVAALDQHRDLGPVDAPIELQADDVAEPDLPEERRICRVQRVEFSDA